MPPRARDRWLAMLLCLAVPGLGHLRTRRARGACWLAAAAVAACAPWPFGPPLWITLAVAGAYDVARLPRTGSARPHVSLVYARGRVDLAMSLDLARSCESLWPFVSDLGRFGVVDPFHDAVEVHADGSLVLDHSFFGVPIVRVGRILRWHDGRGYAFSDLSARGPRRGFPHVFFIELEPRGPDASRLHVRVRGKWTARLLPPFLVRRWLEFVAREHGRLLAMALPEAV